MTNAHSTIYEFTEHNYMKQSTHLKLVGNSLEKCFVSILYAGWRRVFFSFCTLRWDRHIGVAADMCPVCVLKSRVSLLEASSPHGSRTSPFPEEARTVWRSVLFSFCTLRRDRHIGMTVDMCPIRVCNGQNTKRPSKGAGWNIKEQKG